jgi:uncharacterized membrane protein YhiD involved in acid resistance
MYTQFAIAIVLGALMGLERELAGKEAGIRTGMMVASGSAIFTIPLSSRKIIRRMSTISLLIMPAF